MNGKFKVGIKFDKEVLQSLRNDEDSGVELKRTQYHVCLHPIQLNSFSKSIKQVLNQGVAKYNKDLEGILLGFEKTKLLSNEGYIHDDSCYIHLDIEADFYVFTPEIGKEMKGIVNRKSKDHVGLLVYNALNVSILKPKDNEEWLGDYVGIGCEVLFRITFISLASFMPYIRGEVISVLTDVNPLSQANNNDETFTTNNIENTGKKQKFKKRKHDESKEGISNIKRKKVDHSLSDELKHIPVKKKHSKNLGIDKDESPDIANNNYLKNKTKDPEVDNSIQNSTGYTTFEETLHDKGSVEELSIREKKSKKAKNKKRNSSENTPIPSIMERSSKFSPIDCPMLKVIENDSMTLIQDCGDLSSILELDALKEQTSGKAKKHKHKNNELLHNHTTIEQYLNDTQTKLKVKEENISTKTEKSKKQNNVESFTLNIPIMIKEESGYTEEGEKNKSTSNGFDVLVKKKSKKRHKNHEADA